MNPEIWPYRVGMRHFRAPRRQEPGWEEQSGRAGGHIYQQQAGQHGGCDQGYRGQHGARARDQGYGGNMEDVIKDLEEPDLVQLMVATVLKLDKAGIPEVPLLFWMYIVHNQYEVLEDNVD